MATMRKLDLSKLNGYPLTTGEAIARVISNPQLQLTFRQLYERSKLIDRLLANEGGEILIDSGEYAILDQALNVPIGASFEDRPLMTRLMEIPEVEVEEKA